MAPNAQSIMSDINNSFVEKLHSSSTDVLNSGYPPTVAKNNSHLNSGYPRTVEKCGLDNHLKSLLKSGGFPKKNNALSRVQTPEKSTNLIHYDPDVLKSGCFRKKNNSISSVQTPEKSFTNPTNYYSDNASSYVLSSAKKSKHRRSLSSSPILNSLYAGPKFSEPPSPSVLPLPPTHWTGVQRDTQKAIANTPPTEDFADLSEFESSQKEPSMSTALVPYRSISSPKMDVNHTVELFFQKCSFNQLESCKDFTLQLKTLLNVPA